ncbi:MAG: hypothetical protein ABW042_07875 [Phenylobacterium sp.]
MPRRIVGRLRAKPCPEGSNLVRLEPAEPVEAPMPAFTWAQLEAQLCGLRPDRAALTRRVVRMLRRRSDTESSELVLREILCAAWTLLEAPKNA